MYFVVLWDEWSATIPVTWLMTECNTFKWPLSKNPTIESIKQTSPSDNWNTIKYKKYLGPFNTYNEAIAVENEITNISTNDEQALADISAEMNNNGNKALPQRRKVKKPPRYCTSSEENEESDNIAKKKTKLYEPCSTKTSASMKDESNKSCFPKAPTNYKSASIMGINEGNYIKKVSTELSANRNFKTSSHINQHAKVESRIDYDENEELVSTDLVSSPSVLGKINVPNNMENRDISHNHDELCCGGCRNDLHKIKRMLATIQQLLLDANPYSVQDSNINLNLPIATVKELQDFNKVITENSATQLQYAKLIRNIGGKTPEQHVQS